MLEGVPELGEVEQHLQIAVHVAGVALVDQSAVESAHPLLPPQGEHHEAVRLRVFWLEPHELGPLVGEERSARAFDDSAHHLSLAQPAVLSVHHQHRLASPHFPRADLAEHSVVLLSHLHFNRP